MKAAAGTAIKEQIGTNIRKVRQAKELNIKTVCRDLELSPAAYGNIERGITDINMARIIQLAQYFKVHMSVLLQVNTVWNLDFYKRAGKEGEEMVVKLLLEEINFLRRQNDYLLKKKQ
jgi:transcriptional regulator with XRE-family HTH domain